MKDQIDVAVRRSPKYSVFLGIGAVLGIIVAGILAIFVDPVDMPMGYSVTQGLGLMLLVLGIGGAFIGGLVALILDWTGRKRAKEFRVDAQIDMVDDPKEIARRRIAEARGEDPDAGSDEGTAASAGTVDGGAASANTDAAVDGDGDAAPAADGTADAAADGANDPGRGRGAAPDSTL